MGVINESFDDTFPARPLARIDAGGLAPAEGEILALGEGVRAVTRLIEEVGRTLEAQNQRSLRLMERLEQVARALEAGVEANDRELEALDSVGSAIERQQAPLATLPEILRAVDRGSRETRELWTEAVRALGARFAISAAQSEERLRETERRRGRRLALGTALSLVIGAAGAVGAGALFSPRAALREAAARLIGPEKAAVAEEGDGQYHVIRVRTTDPEPPPPTVAPADPVPSGLVRPAAAAPEDPPLAPRSDATRPGAATGPRVEGSLVIEDVKTGGKDLVPSLVEPVN
jgi:hypothetical protein